MRKRAIQLWQATKRHKIILGAAFVLLLFALCLASANIYYNVARAGNLPHRLQVGETIFDSADIDTVHRTLQAKLSKTHIELQHEESGFRSTKSATEIGFAIDKDTIESWKLPSGFYVPKPWHKEAPKQVPVQHTNAPQLEMALEPLRNLPEFQAATDPAFALDNDKLVVLPGKSGWGYNVDTVIQQLQHSLQQGSKNASAKIAFETIGATVHLKHLEKMRPDVEKILAQQHSLEANSRKTELSKEQIIDLIRTERVGQKYQLTIDTAKAKILVEHVAADYNKAATAEITSSYKSGRTATITTKGVDGQQVNNIDTLAEALVQKLMSKQPFEGIFTFDATPFPKKSIVVDDTPRKRVITYSIITWGTVQADFNTFAAQVQETLNDARGWTAAGIAFQRVNSGGSFSVVLSEPARVAAASPICDSYYSCRVGRHVIINDERWRNATPAWTSSLREYRHMVVNHETGHWLGRGHAHCSGAGQPAPVMQQQSISLQGCAPNSWPLTWELNAVRR